MPPPADPDPTSDLFSLPGFADAVGPAAYPFLDPPGGPGELGRVGDYRVLHLLGAGGMGYVFEAEDPGLQRRVAIKVLRPDAAADPEARGRFIDEARAVARLASDHIVTIHQVGTTRGVPFFAMPKLAGETLQARLARGAPLPAAFAARVARDAARGLAAAHAAGLVHRDVKPANLWLETAAGGRDFRRATLLDFGLVRADNRDKQLTAAGMIVGTPNYMSPEQAGGLAVDGRSDLFGLGCVLYIMLSGELAFDGPSTMAVLMALSNRVPPPLARRNRDVPADLSDLVSRLLEKAPDRRPPTAAGVADALDRMLPKLSAAPPPRLTVPGSGADTTVAATDPTPTTAAPPAPPAKVIDRRGWFAAAGAAGAAALFAGGYAAFVRRPGGSVPVGVLHSLTGTMAVSEGPVADATLLAIDEVNRAGGVRGRTLKPIVIDTKSDVREFVAGAEKLLGPDGCAAVFGCWTSASRKAVRPVVERLNGLLFYPVQFEGLELSPRIVYLGPAPNQQLLPAVDYLADALGKNRLFLVGSDYVFPHAAHAIIKDAVKAKPGVSVVGEAYLPLGETDVAAVVKKILAAKPDAVVNTINGTTNFAFFKGLRAAGPKPADLPILSVSVVETDFAATDPADVAGDYVAGTYFQSVDEPAGRAFLAAVRAKYGPDRTFSDPMAAAYAGVHLWAAAAAAADSPDPAAVLERLRGAEFAGPAGNVRIDPDTLHAWLPVRIGKVGPDLQIQTVAGAAAAVKPVPFPTTRTPAEWDRFLTSLYVGWNASWGAPPARP